MSEPVWPSSGMKCECINDDWGPFVPVWVKTPTKGPIYEVTKVDACRGCGNPRIGLAGFDSQFTFHADQFRPLVKKDEEMFRSMLAPTDPDAGGEEPPKVREREKEKT